MRKLTLLLFVLFCAGPVSAATWYVRTDGGTSSQCVGTTDAAYPGSGTAQPCAYNDPQLAINASAGGDTITIRANDTFSGAFTLPNKAGSSYITVQSSAAASLPTDTRIGPAQSSLMPKLMASVDAEPALQTQASAHHYKFIGIEFLPISITIAPTFDIYDIVRIGTGSETSLSTIPTNITFERCWIHGLDGESNQRGISFNVAEGTVKDSYISKIHGLGFDTQAICTWNGPGPLHFINNFLEGAGENILIGGSDPKVTNLVPSDIEIKRNYIFKPLSWKAGDPSYAGFHWTIKNSLELKNAKNVTIDANIIENCWVDGQTGVPVLFTVRNQDNTAPWSTVENVTFTNNIVRGTKGVINFLGWDNEGAPGLQSTGATISNNLAYNISSEPWVLINRFYNVTINHNTHFQPNNILLFNGENSTGFVYKNDLTIYADYGIVGFDSGGGSIFGTPVLAVNAPGYQFNNNVIVGAAESGFTYSTAGGNSYPSSVTTVQFTDLAGGNYQLLSTSPYHNAGTDGADIGVNIPALKTALGGTSDVFAAGSTKTETGNWAGILPGPITCNWGTSPRCTP